MLIRIRNWEFDSSAYYFYITLNILEMVTISMVKKKKDSDKDFKQMSAMTLPKTVQSHCTYQYM